MEAPKQRISLQLGAHHISLVIDPAQEPIYRDAAARLEAKYKQYVNAFPSLSVEQIWIYVALDMAVNLQSDAREKNIAPLLAKMRELNQLITETLTEEKGL